MGKGVNENGVWNGVHENDVWNGDQLKWWSMGMVHGNRNSNGEL